MLLHVHEKLDAWLTLQEISFLTCWQCTFDLAFAIELHAFDVALTILLFVARLWRTRLVCMLQAAWYISWLLVKFLLKGVVLSFFSGVTPLANCVWPAVYGLCNAKGSATSGSSVEDVRQGL